MPPRGIRRVGATAVVAAVVSAHPVAAEPQPDRLETSQSTQAITEFWAAYAHDGDVAKVAAKLDHALRTEGGPDSRVARSATRVLVAHHDGDHRGAWSKRLELIGVPVPAAFRPFVGAALAASDHEFGMAVAVPRSRTELPAFDGNNPARMTDGDDTTYFWSAVAPAADARLVMDLGRVRPVRAVQVSMGKADRPSDTLRAGVLEHSVDGRAWSVARKLSGEPVVDARIDADARYFRLRTTSRQRQWLAVREFAVTVEPTDAWSDGDVATTFPVTRTPVTIRPDPARDAAHVVVLAGRDTPAGAEIQAREGDRWRTLGRVSGAYTEVASNGTSVDEIRIVAPADAPLPVVHEIVVRPK
ncbi:MAG: discoidin domain-containing protein [Actinomycetota bacterium]|nr:discoidin domain-containing protein [Actinomycetota bacterium]